ncbi:hypothetical protein AGMMS49992_07250 [Clostridia bacterium]|nr:hypothetical protein AGMMS49992_07250 [Clostridia bacterium]
MKEFADWVAEQVKRIPRWARWAALGAVGLIIAAELVFGWGLPAPRLDIPTLTAETQARRLTASGEGTVAPFERGVVTASAAGTVQMSFFNAGDVVRKGDLILLLENADASRAAAESNRALDAAKAAVAPALANAPSEVIISPVSGRIITMRGAAGDTIQSGAYARIAVSGAMAVVLSDDRLAVAVGETVRVESDTPTGSIETEGIVTEREMGVARIVITDARFVENQGVRVFDPDGNLAGTGTLTADETAVVWGVSGVIRTAHKVTGDWIDAGQPLFTLEGPLSLPGYETQMQTIEAAARDAAAAQGAVEALSIYAPADGILNNLTVRTGSNVRSGEALALLTDRDSRLVVLPVSSNWLDIIKPGQNATVSAAGVLYVGAVESVTQTAVSVSLPLAAPQDAEASVIIDTGIEREAIWVPASAIHTNPDGSAYVLRAPDPDELPYAWLKGPIGRLFRPTDENIVESLAAQLKTSVTIGITVDGMTEIVGGVRLGSGIMY